MRALEDWLGSALFVRSGNRATLLPHAAVLAGALDGAFGEIDGGAACVEAARVGTPEHEVALPSTATMVREIART